MEPHFGFIDRIAHNGIQYYSYADHMNAYFHQENFRTISLKSGEMDEIF